MTTYHKNGTDHNLEYRRPVIQLNDQNQVISINYSPPFLGTVSIPFSLIEDYYNAWYDFTKVKIGFYFGNALRRFYVERTWNWNLRWNLVI
jgi:hypothetical protein